MQLAGIVTARFVAFIETLDLNPRGHAYFPKMVPAMVDRYGFAKFPQKLEEFDETKGILFEGGRFKDVTIQRIQVFSNVLVAETASSTTDSESILEDALLWASETFGLLYRPGMIKRKAYVSQLTFQSDVPLNTLHVALARLSSRISTIVPEFVGQSLKYEATGITIGYESLATKLTLANFTIERMADTPFSENKYFSQAPLPTEQHITLLKEFEADLLTIR
jgi:hypothetical protein